MDLCVFDGVGVALDNMKYQQPGAHGAVIFFPSNIQKIYRTSRRCTLFLAPGFFKHYCQVITSPFT